MSDNVLKKEFQQKDVQRLRNLMTGKYGEKTIVGTGYTKQQEFHDEGDVWEENEKTWTIKNGIKQTVTKLDSIKNEYRTPLLCPSCNARMQGRVDKKMYSIHGKCSTCVAKMESKLKLEGKYQDYVKAGMVSKGLKIVKNKMKLKENSSYKWLDNQWSILIKSYKDVKEKKQESKNINLTTNVFYIIKDSWSFLEGIQKIKSDKIKTMVDLLDQTRLRPPLELLKK